MNPLTQKSRIGSLVVLFALVIAAGSIVRSSLHAQGGKGAPRHSWEYKTLLTTAHTTERDTVIEMNELGGRDWELVGFGTICTSPGVGEPCAFFKRAVD
jgi:hypothetical protein